MKKVQPSEQKRKQLEVLLSSKTPGMMEEFSMLHQLRGCFKVS